MKHQTATVRKTKTAVPQRSGPRLLGEKLPVWGVAGILAGMTVLMFIRILLGKAFLWEDFLYYSYPVRNFAAVSVASGYLPLWNPFTFAGMPFQADIQTAVFYLPNLLLTLFVSAGHLAPYWLEVAIVLHYPLAGAGMMLLASSYGMKRLPALFAGATFMLSGFMIAHAIHQQIVTLVAWYPLLVFLFRKVILEEKWFWVFLAGPLLGHAVLAGHPQFALYLYVLLGIVTLFEILSTFRGASLIKQPALVAYSKVITAFAIGLGTAAIQLLPTLEMSGLSVRAEMSYANSTVGSVSWSQLGTLIFPKLLGSAGANGYEFFGGPYWSYWETMIYLGILPLLLALVSIQLARRNRYVALYCGLALFALLYSLGGNFILHRFFFTFVPGFSTFRNPGRMGVLFSFAMSLLAGFGLDEILAPRTESIRGWNHRVAIGIAAGAGAFLWLLLQIGALDDILPFLKDQQSASLVKSNATLQVLILLGSAALLYSLVRNKATRLAQALLIPAFLIDMLVFGESQNASDTDPSEYYRQAGSLVAFVRNQSVDELFRVNTRAQGGMMVDRNQGMVDRIFMTEGYTPLALQRLFPPAPCDTVQFDLLNVKYRTVIGARGSRASLAPNPGYLPRAFFLYDARLIQGEEAIKAAMTSRSFPFRTTAIVEKELPIALSSAGVGRGTVQWTNYEPAYLRCVGETTQDALLVFSEISYPGWHATVDSIPVEVFRTDYSLRGVPVQAGHHVIEMRFAPESFDKGRWLTALSLAISLVAGGFSLAGSFRSTVEKKEE